MNSPIADQELREKGLAVLEDGLGPVQTLRFLALISRQPFDYQKWRDGEFGTMTLAEILSSASTKPNTKQ